MFFTDEDKKRLGRIETKLDTLLKLITQEGDELMAKIDDLITEVAEETSVITSAGVLLDGLSAQIQALRDDLAQAGIDTTKIDQVLTTLQANKAALQEAIVRNTPSANTP